MPSWGAVLNSLQRVPNPLDEMRRKYLGIMHQYTERNVIAYYSGFIQKPRADGTGIDDNDKNALMQAVCGLDRSKGLDLILHTPGGQVAAAESLVSYLKALFGNDIRTFVPQMAMSAGTMIALSTKEIVMGRQSNLGPIDPQFGGMSCAGIIEEFDEACAAVAVNPNVAAVWGPIISKYHPTFIGDCKKAIDWADQMVKKWLAENMFSEYSDNDARAATVVDTLSSHNATFSHSRHIHADELRGLGLHIVQLEGLDDRQIDESKDLQDCVLTIHHSYMHTFASSNAIKIVENHAGNTMIINATAPR
ncbi:SDH family Clp fold serine proteinase [Pseudoflavonifractor capillosus]|uniref:SDH family Clp fold serine proteinase n=1 Tax=Pseudoflavonifractor capillosus TaxID=106588 RepID=UPI002A830112|nr:serine protease [Pseudoflavonifractor capillosus]MDY4661565.1 serine protease [Pseudoflavonifractor capillosus]